MYDPRLGRFLSEDPTGMADGVNVYTYAHNDPVNGVDPSGLSRVPAQMGVSGGSSRYQLLPGVQEVYHIQMASLNRAIDASHAQLWQMEQEIDAERRQIDLRTMAAAGRALREQSQRDPINDAIRYAASAGFDAAKDVSPVYQQAMSAWNEAERGIAVWNNTHFMGTGERLYVTGGVVAGDTIGLTNLSDAASRHDAVDGHVQTTAERVLKGGSGSIQLAGIAGLAAHGNSLSYVGQTHVYAIRGPNGTYKIGQSMRGLRLDGASIRGEAQARALRKATGDAYESSVLKSFPDKASARSYETRLIERFRDMYGDNTLPGNKSNR